MLRSFYLTYLRRRWISNIGYHERDGVDTRIFASVDMWYDVGCLYLPYVRMGWDGMGRGVVSDTWFVWRNVEMRGEDLGRFRKGCGGEGELCWAGGFW